MPAMLGRFREALCPMPAIKNAERKHPMAFISGKSAPEMKRNLGAMTQPALLRGAMFYARNSADPITGDISLARYYRFIPNS
jgi:hypothetical protein